MNEYINRNTGLIMLIVIIALMGLTYWFGIRSISAIIASEKEDIQKSITIRENRERQLGKTQEYQNQYDAILKDEDKLRVFTEKEHMIDFIKQLEGLANERGVSIIIETRDNTPVKAVSSKSTAPSEGQDIGGKTAAAKADPSILGNLPTQEYTHLALKVSGDTKSVISYIHEVETLPVALDVIAIDSTRKEKEIQEPVSPGPAPSEIPAGDSPEHGGVGLFVVNPISASPVVQTVPKQAFELQVVVDTIVYHLKPKKE